MAHIYWERRDLEDDARLRQLLEGEGAPTGDCTPPLDVIETATHIELLMDVPGVARSDIKIVFSKGTLIVAGRKTPGSCAHREAAFHLAERSFGRFVRAVRLMGAFDGGGGHATLESGELRIRLPRIEERRGREIRIEIDGA